MKKVISIFAMCIFLSACNNSPTNQEVIVNTSDESATTTTADVTTEMTTIETETTTTTATTTVTTTTPETTITTTTESLVDLNRDTIVRNVCWGDTTEIVKYVETDELYLEDKDFLAYYTTISGINAIVTYSFDSEYGLYSVAYQFNDSIENSGMLAISYYEKIKDAVIKKYGEPTNDVKKPMSNLYEYCDSDSQALELGYLGYTTSWEYNNTKIDMVLATVNYNMHFGLIFDDATFEVPTDTSGL